MKYSNIKVVAFDADDTLWDNEPYFRESEKQFCELLKEFSTDETSINTLFKTEIDNLKIYGYGIKGFILSMIETALIISNNKISQLQIKEIILLGKEMLNKPVVLLPGVENVLNKLQGKYKLIMATKGDLLDQEKKLHKSGLNKYFHHIEVMTNKEIDDYKNLIKHLDIYEDEFLMIGNSLKSDIIPVLNIGGYGIQIPYHTTWAHEEIIDKSYLKNSRFTKIENISALLDIL